MPDDDILEVEHGAITVLTMNRPERHNAINTALGDRLVEEFTRAGRNPEVKAIILRGAGPSFCSGDDRTEGAGGSIPDFPWTNPYHSEHIEPFAVFRHGYFQLISLIRRVPQPVIAQIHGYCMGSGADLMLAADFAIADPDAKIHFIFGARGIGPAGTALLPRYVGLKQTMRLLFDSEPVSPEEAVRLGLITRVATPGNTEEEVRRLAQGLAELGRSHYGYMGMVKEAVNRAAYPNLDEDVRTQILTTRLADFFRMSHPAPAES